MHCPPEQICIQNLLWIHHVSYHVQLDQAREAKRDKDKKIGTTGKGIGPAYEDKVARRSIRAYDLLHLEALKDKLMDLLDYHNFVLTKYLGVKGIDFKEQWDSLEKQAFFIKPFLTDVSEKLYALLSKERINPNRLCTSLF